MTKTGDKAGMRSLLLMISLPHAEQRRRRMEAILSSRGLDWTVVPGILGRELTPGDLDRLLPQHRRMGLGPGEYGCLLSHVACWRRLLASPADRAVVLEDDIHIATDFGAILNALTIEDDLIGVVRLETMLATVTADLVPRQRIGRRGLYEIHSLHGGTAAYVVNRATASFLIDAVDHMTHAIDIEMFSPERRSFAGLRVFQLHPAPCIQDMFLPRSEQVLGGDSAIVGSRADDVAGTPSSHLEPARRLLRPAYRLAYSLALLPWRRRRMKVTMR